MALTLEHWKQSARQTLKPLRSSRWIAWLARLGYAAKGLVYIILGVLAAQVALGSRSETPETQDAFVVLALQPYGPYILGVVALGLGGYVLWRFVQALWDAERKGTSLLGLAQRAGYVLNGVAYAGVAMVALQVLLGQRGGSDAAEDWAARLLNWPVGHWLVGLLGVAIMAIAVEEIVRGVRTDICETFNLRELSRLQTMCVTAAGRLGLVARGAVYGIIGFLLLQAAIHLEADEAGGLGDALQTLLRQPFGPLLLVIVAVGFIAYGGYALVEARYRAIRAP